MNKKLLTLSALALVTLFSACNNDDDDNDDPNPLAGSFHALIDGVNWDAQADNVGAIETDFGSGSILSINGSNETDTTHFFFSLPYFLGTDTTVTEPSTDIVLRFQGAHVWDATTGTLNVTRTVQDGIETYTGTFSGHFEEFFDSTSVREITGGTFTVKRLI